MTRDETLQLGSTLTGYCKKFNVPVEHIFEILEDQKVVPMIRGKAMEYNLTLVLRQHLSPQNWNVEKLNLNAQSGAGDEDVSITHKRTGIRLRAESKSTKRGSMTSGIKSREIKQPHFLVKCHRSRSNKKLTTNDMYSVDSFDVILTNTSNAIFQGGTIGENLEIIYDEVTKGILYEYYGVTDDIQLLSACYNDWRFCIPSDIGVEGFIPRNPKVRLLDDPNWRPLSELEDRLMQVVRDKRSQPTARSRS
jgi:hypothetical protein